MATTRPDGRPHLAPLWFVYVDDRIWIGTGDGSVRVANLRSNDQAALSLEDGDTPIAAEGTIAIHEQDRPEAVVAAFAEKYGWDITAATDDDLAGRVVLLEFRPQRWLFGIDLPTVPVMSEPEPTETSLFTGAPVHDLFNCMYDLFPSVAMRPATTPYTCPEGRPFVLPATHDFLGDTHDTARFLDESDTAALLVLQHGEIRHEHYALTGGRDVQWISWSVAKSFVSALVGIAVSEGHIDSIDDPIDRYAPGLTGTAYDGVRIEDVLQMSSGARWIEDYSDPSSDVHRLGAVARGEATLDEFMAGMVRELEPATLCRYNSADTQALGMLLVGATGRPIAEYMTDKLVEPLGMEKPSHWLTDTVGREQAYGGLTMTARDFAKIGELYRRGGEWHGTQVVPREWVDQSLRFDRPHLEPGQTMIGSQVLPTGYGYQWWLYPGEHGDYSAIGIYNQHVYVDPPSGAVIVKLSANRRYGMSHLEEDNKSGQTYTLFRAIVDALG